MKVHHQGAGRANNSAGEGSLAMTDTTQADREAQAREVAAQFFGYASWQDANENGGMHGGKVSQRLADTLLAFATRPAGIDEAPEPAVPVGQTGAAERAGIVKWLRERSADSRQASIDCCDDEASQRWVARMEDYAFCADQIADGVHAYPEACPVCSGDCSSANPPVLFCPMRDHAFTPGCTGGAGIDDDPPGDMTAGEVDQLVREQAAGGPHEWGYRDPADGSFIADDWPFRILAALSTPVSQPIEDRIRAEGLALRAIKAVTATAKDGRAGLSRIMAIASAAGVKAQYTELLADPDVALIVEHSRTEWAHLFEPMSEGCALPPDGWYCTRARGHSGPCAALRQSGAERGDTA